MKKPQENIQKTPFAGERVTMTAQHENRFRRKKERG